MPRLFFHARDPLSSYSHFLGLILSITGTIIMAHKISALNFDIRQIFGLLFCISLSCLYGASSLYHFSNTASVIQKLRKLDHSMIYVLIAGSYTPLLYAVLPSPKNFMFIAVIWAIALCGIIIKLLWMNVPRKVSTTLYIIMGWFIAVDFPALGTLPAAALGLLISGGLFYTIGGIIYALKKPNINEMLGFHEIFHIFVILGSICHYMMVFLYLI